MSGDTLFVTGTGTDVGKTVVTAALAATARGSVAVLKPAQTGSGEDGDLVEVERMTGGGITTLELARHRDPLAPAVAARREAVPPVTPARIVSAAEELAAAHDLVLVEGAGGLLVPYDDSGGTLPDAAVPLGAPVLVVCPAGLGALNTAALTVRELRHRKLDCPGLVVGSWPTAPDLAARCNVVDLPSVTGVPLLGALPEGAGRLRDEEFRTVARAGLAPSLGGEWDAAALGAPS
ncbi:dethiobiotin synthetase [Actinopolyspora xinjiangensis]|uniref:ATP-dependent dethiobiotin synthetase BioD n=1 Tax=Actinopolyspora xinjiangensis TaxID=405564 RepID=A0A1H0QTW6_9ACTN|nr:dethiobiotin synthase [Actinopolyspora xinjiangensis]SDP20763.1 dethiobiotin synthetase [Actinopolyspora xinjiangensis]